MSNRIIRKNNAAAATEPATGGVFYIIKGLLLSLVLSALLIMLFAAIITAFCPTEGAVMISASAAVAAATLFSGIYISKHIQKSGLVNGALAGLLYGLVTFLIGAVAGGGVNLGADRLVMLLLAAGFGAAGGVFGVNTGKRRRYSRKS